MECIQIEKDQVYFGFFFSFLSRPSSALISSSSTQVLVDHWGTFCAGGYPNVHFSFFHLHGCSGDYQADTLPPDHAVANNSEAAWIWNLGGSREG